MKKLYHDAIFYPRERESLLEMTKIIDKKTKAKALILPHQDLRRCYNLYIEAFSHLVNPKRIIILSPIHSELLIKDEGKFIFEGESGRVETPNGEIEISTLGLDKAEYYAEEEYAPELILQYIASEYKNIETCIAYVSIKNADEAKKLSKLIAKWNDENTVFIISSNLTGKMMKEDMLKERENASSMILSGEKLMDSYRKGKINVCGVGIIDALNRAIEGKWNLIALSDNDETTGHGAFFKEFE